MWENVIGVVNEQAGSNAGVEALIRAPTHGGGRRAAEERRQAAHDVVLATGGFDTAITNYQSLLTLARSQGAVGGGNERGACKVCGQLGHLTKQCRNHLSKHYKGGPGAAAAGAAAPGLDTLPPPEEPASSMSDLTDSSEDSEDSRRRRRRSSERRDKKSTRDKDKKKRRSKERKERKEKVGGAVVGVVPVRASCVARGDCPCIPSLRRRRAFPYCRRGERSRHRSRNGNARAGHPPPTPTDGSVIV